MGNNIEWCLSLDIRDQRSLVIKCLFFSVSVYGGSDAEKGQQADRQTGTSLVEKKKPPCMQKDKRSEFLKKRRKKSLKVWRGKEKGNEGEGEIRKRGRAGEVEGVFVEAELRYCCSLPVKKEGKQKGGRRVNSRRVISIPRL